MINALNSGAKSFIADFEDSNAPTWENNMNGQINLMDAVRKSMFFTGENGKEYKLNKKQQHCYAYRMMQMIVQIFYTNAN